MGGVATDLRAATDLPGLYAVGKCLHRGPWRQPAGQQLLDGMPGVRPSPGGH